MILDLFFSQRGLGYLACGLNRSCKSHLFTYNSSASRTDRRTDGRQTYGQTDRRKSDLNSVYYVTLAKTYRTTISLFITSSWGKGRDSNNREVWSTDGSLALPKKVTGEYFTRGNCNKLLLRRCRYELRKIFFSNRIVNMWNSLPDTLLCRYVWYY